MKQKAT